MIKIAADTNVRLRSADSTKGAPTESGVFSVSSADRIGERDPRAIK